MSELFFQSPQPIDIDDSTPLVFLEGPVQGTSNWQTAFAHRLLEKVPGIAVASPRPIQSQVMDFASSNTLIRERASERQVAYELLARRLAFGHGAIAMWWAAKEMGHPYNPQRVYAKTTSKEEAEVWGVLFSNPEFPFVVGYDPEFEAGPQNSRAYSERNHALMGIETLTSFEDVYTATEKAAQKVVASGGSRQVPALTSQSIQRALDLLR